MTYNQTLPIVSVVMPVFNGERYLRPAIDSILAQTWRNFEFLIINDGSTDETTRILHEIASTDAHIRVLHGPRRGLVHSLNEGCAEAAGHYIARMDSDDIAMPERLRLQVDFLNNHPAVALVGSSMAIINDDGNVFDTWRYPTEPARIKDALLETNCLAHPTIMMRKSAFDAAGRYRNTFLYAEDYDLWLRMSEHYEIANLNEPTLFYRVHDRQISIRQLKKRTLSTLAAQMSARGRRKLGYDPFAGIEEITSDALCDFGFTSAEIQNAFIDGFLGSLSLMLKSNQRSGFNVLKEAQHLLQAECISDSLMKNVAARILALAYHFYSHKQYAVSRQLLKLCVRLDAGFLGSMRTIRLATKLALGERQARRIAAIKRGFARSESSLN